MSIRIFGNFAGFYLVINVSLRWLKKKSQEILFIFFILFILLILFILFILLYFIRLFPWSPSYQFLGFYDQFLSFVFIFLPF